MGHRDTRGVSAQERKPLSARWFSDCGFSVGRMRAPQTCRAPSMNCLLATAGQAPESIVCPHITGMNDLPESIARTWLLFARETEILDLVESLIGPDIILWGSQVFLQAGGDRHGSAVASGRRILADSTAGNLFRVDRHRRCLRLKMARCAISPVPIARANYFRHVVSERHDLALNRVLDPNCYDESTAAYDELASGQLSLHDVYLIHGSAANTSGKRRAGFAIRYMPATSQFDRQLDMGSGSKHFATQFATRPIFLMRGYAHSNSKQHS